MNMFGTSQSGRPPGLLGLPVELRNEIDSYLLTDHGVLRRTIRHGAVQHVFDAEEKPSHPILDPDDPVLRAFQLGPMPTLAKDVPPRSWPSKRSLLQTTTTPPPPKQPRNVNDHALLCVDRQLRQEAGDLLYGMYKLHLETSINDLPVAIAYLRRAMDLTGRAMPFAGLRLKLDVLDLANLESLFPLLNFVRSSGFASDFQFVAGWSHWASISAGMTCRALRLAARAARPGWTGDKLRQEVVLWARRERQALLAKLEMAGETIRRKFKMPIAARRSSYDDVKIIRWMS